MRKALKGDGMTNLEVHYLWFDYNTGPVLKDACLTAKPGRVSGLLGPKVSGLAMWQCPSKTDFSGAQKALMTSGRLDLPIACSMI